MTTKAERAEAIARLRELLKPGATVHTILRDVSKSGMSRTIDLFLLQPRKDGTVGRYWLSGLAAKAAGFTLAPNDRGLRVSGCGMDMGFHVVYSLSHAIFADLRGKRILKAWGHIPGHSNGADNWGQTTAKRPTVGDAGYLLKQEWL